MTNHNESQQRFDWINVVMWLSIAVLLFSMVLYVSDPLIADAKVWLAQWGWFSFHTLIAILLVIGGSALLTQTAQSKDEAEAWIKLCSFCGIVYWIAFALWPLLQTQISEFIDKSPLNF